jgi:hypothetical protein
VGWGVLSPFVWHGILLLGLIMGACGTAGNWRCARAWFAYAPNLRRTFFEPLPLKSSNSVLQGVTFVHVLKLAADFLFKTDVVPGGGKQQHRLKIHIHQQSPVPLVPHTEPAAVSGTVLQGRCVRCRQLQLASLAAC